MLGLPARGCGQSAQRCGGDRMRWRALMSHFRPLNEREMRAGHLRAHFDPAEPIRAGHRARRRSP